MRIAVLALVATMAQTPATAQTARAAQPKVPETMRRVARYIVSTLFDPNIDDDGVATAVSMGAMMFCANISPIHPQGRSSIWQAAQNVGRRGDRLDQHGWFSIATNWAGTPRQPQLVAKTRRRTTNPIPHGRVTGFAQSGFNEIAHSAKLDDHRRATSQNPPDSQSGCDLIQHRELEEPCDGSTN